MKTQINNSCFKKIIIIFWTFWWLIALWTDLIGGLAHWGLLHKTWAPDINYPFLASSLSMYHPPTWLINCLSIGILFWSGISAGAFCWASLGLHKSASIWLHRAEIAFIISLSFWLAFFVADQIVMKFDLEQNHMVQGGFEFLCFLMIYLLPPKMEMDNLEGISS